MCTCCNEARSEPQAFRFFAEGCLHCAARRIQYIQRRLPLSPDDKRNRCRNPCPSPEGGRMKPRIIKLQGIWHCGVRGIPNKRIGVGYTPRQAYQDWLGVGHG